jgi:hypothetical protein
MKDKPTHGGKRTGAGRPSEGKPLKKRRAVDLTDEEYKAIVGKYGTFVAGVRTLIPN